VSRLLLDTTFLIDAERNAVELDAVIDDDDDVAIAAITVAELLVGVRLATGRRARRREVIAQEMIEALPVIDYDLAVAAAHADLLADLRRLGSPRGAHDLIIAATAVATGRTVVTADAAAFNDLAGVHVVGYR
jgi:tRNA(fMet)-specific endonuclease VapC